MYKSNLYNKYLGFSHIEQTYLSNMSLIQYPHFSHISTFFFLIRSFYMFNPNPLFFKILKLFLLVWIQFNNYNPTLYVLWKASLNLGLCKIDIPQNLTLLGFYVQINYSKQQYQRPINNICMNLKYNRIDMKTKTKEGNYRMKLRKRPSSIQCQQLCQPIKKKMKVNKIKRDFGTDLTNLPAVVPMEIQSQLNQTTNILSQIQPYLFSIENHIDNMDSAYLNTIMQQLILNSNLPISITEGMRRVLLLWLMQVGTKFQVKNETIHICTQIIDYVLLFDNQKINRDNFQLLGIAAMFVASKYNQIHTYEAAKYVFVCDGLYTIKDLFEMEGIILSVTKFNLQFPTIHQHIGIILQKAHTQSILNNIIQLSNLSMLDFSLFNRFKKRDLAAVIFYLALKLENPHQIKSKDIIAQSNMTESTFKECLQSLLKLYRQRQRNFNNK